MPLITELSGQSGNYQFIGIYEATSFSANADIDRIRFLSGSDGLTLRKPSAEGKLKAFRAYFLLPIGIYDLILDMQSTDLAITTARTTDAAAYDLNGLVISGPSRVIIKEGKKYIVSDSRNKTFIQR